MRGGIIESFADFTNIVGKVHNFSPSTRLIAILFMREGQEITDKGIVPFLNYFDIRSGKALHFILPGWVHREAGRGTDHSSVGKEWIYSDSLFTKACEVIASETRWKYSGGTDLVLVTTRKAANINIVVDFSGAINIALHVMKEKKLVESTEVLFERLIRFAESYQGPDPLLKLSLQEARVSLVEGVINAVLSCLPKGMKERLEYSKQFLIQDISKETRSGKALIHIV
jgi:hypothetical protein